ncbi:GTP-binding protein Rho1, partial [Ceratobasidium sp. 370]
RGHFNEWRAKLLGGTPPNKREWSETEINTPHGAACMALWDTSAHEDYDRLRPLSYPDTGIVAFVCGIDSPDSLTNIEQKWDVEVGHFCPGTPKVVIGCKSDLRTGNDPRSLGINLATRLGARHYVEFSAQQYVGIEKLLECIGSMAWEIYEHTKANGAAPTGFELSVTLPEKDAPQEGKGGKDGALYSHDQIHTIDTLFRSLQLAAYAVI